MTLSYLITENKRIAKAMTEMHSNAKPFTICAAGDLSSLSCAGSKGSEPAAKLALGAIWTGMSDEARPLGGISIEALRAPASLPSRALDSRVFISE